MLLYAPIISYLIIGPKAVATLSKRVSQINVETRFNSDKNTWPPDQVKNFTPLLLVHYQGHRTPEQVTAMAELMCTGDISKVASVTGDHSTHPELDSQKKIRKAFDTNIATKEIHEILTPLEKGEKSCFILIEGVPGIGKSVLLKEIAYRWGKNELLKKFELVLLVCLRDPSLQQIKSVDDLLQLFCMGDKKATELVSICSEYLFDNGGKNVALLLDGYDEFPEHLRESSLLANILQRRILPHCGLVVSSRPHASEHLRQRATTRVDILGFTEMEREHYITQALSDQPHKITEITKYLHQRPAIDGICFVPFNMVILLYLYKLGISLPKNSSELYRHFICFTICRHISKSHNHLTHVKDLTSLPQPYNRAIQQLSKFSMDILMVNKLVFTFDEIEAACPGIAAIPGAINGFGLLQAVQHFGLYEKTTTLNFIHFTIQEFLAAHYISHLPPKQELKVIKENFWSNIHFNMFSIYISLTKGQRKSFKKFLSGGNKATAISQEFLKDQLMCLHLYHCFSEADDYTMCNAIAQADVFNNRVINLMGTTLTASEMECISPFLTSSFNKEWVELNLWSCYIQNKGMTILYRGLYHTRDISINHLVLMDNGLTMQSSSLISELTVKCKVKELVITGNHTIGEDQQLYFMLTDPSNILETLYLSDTKLSSRAAIALFTALKDNNNLKVLIINNNAITDDACDAIITSLERNSCLVKLSMYDNPISSKTILSIVQCLGVNSTLQIIGLPPCSHNVKSLQEVVNTKRESQGCQVKLEIKFALLW